MCASVSKKSKERDAEMQIQMFVCKRATWTPFELLKHLLQCFFLMAVKAFVTCEAHFRYVAKKQQKLTPRGKKDIRNVLVCDFAAHLTASILICLINVKLLKITISGVLILRSSAKFSATHIALNLQCNVHKITSRKSCGVKKQARIRRNEWANVTYSAVAFFESIVDFPYEFRTGACCLFANFEMLNYWIAIYWVLWWSCSAFKFRKHCCCRHHHCTRHRQQPQRQPDYIQRTVRFAANFRHDTESIASNIGLKTDEKEMQNINLTTISLFC